jgi:hypothetical protein
MKDESEKTEDEKVAEQIQKESADVEMKNEE